MSTTKMMALSMIQSYYGRSRLLLLVMDSSFIPVHLSPRKRRQIITEANQHPSVVVAVALEGVEEPLVLPPSLLQEVALILATVFPSLVLVLEAALPPENHVSRRLIVQEWSKRSLIVRGWVV
jgi:hypothetical protein